MGSSKAPSEQAGPLPAPDVPVSMHSAQMRGSETHFRCL